MSAWFTVAVSPKVGSLAAVTAALASAGIAVEGIMGAPEGDGSLHVGVPDAQLPAAISALTALGLHPMTEEWRVPHSTRGSSARSCADLAPNS